LPIPWDLPPPFGNFHDAKAEGQDYKIRFAFTGTPFYGAYMTDIIKEVVMLKARDLMCHLAANQHFVAESVERLLKEFDDLKSESPTDIVFGGSTPACCQAPPRESILTACARYALQRLHLGNGLPGAGSQRTGRIVVTMLLYSSVTPSRLGL